MSNLLSQLAVEVLLLPDPPPVRLSQLPVEVLHSATPEVTVTETVQTFVVMPA